MQEMKKNRIDYFDIAKGFGIILVILGHCKIKKYQLLFNFIYCFHMPMFFIISGYFFRQRENRELMKKIVKNFIIPYIITCSAIIIFHLIRGIMDGLDNEGLINISKTWLLASLYGSGNRAEYGIKPIGAIWFLLALSVATVIMNTIFNYKNRYFIEIVIAYVGYKTSKFIWIPFSLQAGMMAIIFMEVGIYFKENIVFERKIPLQVYLFCIFLSIFGVKYCGKLFMVENSYTNGILDIVIAICMTFLYIKICRLLSNTKFIKQFFIFIGINSLEAMCIHLFSLDCFKWKTFYDFLLKIGIKGYATRNFMIQFSWVMVMLIIVQLLRKISEKIVIKKMINY